MSRKKKSRRQAAQGLPEWAAKIRSVRGDRTQAEFAHLCNVTQVTISRWESGTDQPTPGAYARLATLCGKPNRAYFWELSGFQDIFPAGPDWYTDPEGLQISPVPSILKQRLRDEDTTKIPLLRDSLYIGTKIEDDDWFVSEYLLLPEHWFGEDGQLVAIEATGDSMAPIIPQGSIVIVDTSQKDPDTLVDTMVATREWNGITIKWLKRKGDIFVLLPERRTLMESAKVLRPKGDFSIAGAVVKWIASPIRK